MPAQNWAFRLAENSIFEVLPDHHQEPLCRVHTWVRHASSPMLIADLQEQGVWIQFESYAISQTKYRTKDLDT